MNRSMQTVGSLALAAAVLTGGIACAEDAASGKPEPHNVDKVALELLNTPVNMRVTNMRMSLAWGWAAKLAGTNLPIVVWPQAGEKKVSLEFIDAPLAEVLRKVKEQTGAEHRFRDGKIHLLMPEEVAAFERGEAPKPAEEKKEAPAADSGAPEPQKVGDEAKLLMKEIMCHFVNMPLVNAMNALNLNIGVSKQVGERRVHMVVEKGTLGEALKKIEEQAGCTHRWMDGRILIGTAEEFKAIEAGKAAFEEMRPRVPQGHADNPVKETKSFIDFATGETKTQYRIGERWYSEEDLKKEKPDVFATLDEHSTLIMQGDPNELPPLYEGATKEEDALARKEIEAMGENPSISFAKDGNFQVGGKTYTDAEFKKLFPVTRKFYRRINGMPDEGKAADSGQPEPQKVGDEAELLMKKVTLELANTPLGEALGFLSTLSQVPTECDKGIAQKTVTLKLANATMAEAMKQIKETAGGEHRVVDGTIRIASPEQWKAIDAGTAKFEIAGTATGGKADQSAGWPNTLWTAHVGVVGKDGEKSDPALRNELFYQIDGKRYSVEQLQKEKPDVWKQIQESKRVTTVPATAKVQINGKLYSLKEVQDQFPILWESLHLKIEE